MGRGTILGTQQIRASCWKSTKPFSFRKSFTSDLQSVFFASMDKKLLLLKVGRPTLANCRHSLKDFQMRRDHQMLGVAGLQIGGDCYGFSDYHHLGRVSPSQLVPNFDATYFDSRRPFPSELNRV